MSTCLLQIQNLSVELKIQRSVFKNFNIQKYRFSKIKTIKFNPQNQQ